MKKFVYRTLAGIVASLTLALPCAAEVAVVGCLFDSTNPQITDDPNQCPPERKLDIVSIKTSWTQPLATTGGGGGGAESSDDFGAQSAAPARKPAMANAGASGGRRGDMDDEIPF